jgi:ribose transport system permease protein
MRSAARSPPLLGSFSWRGSTRASPRAGEGYELDIITAVVLGGVSIFGGVGRLTGVLAGVLIMGVLANGMILLNIDEYVQWVVKGSVLLAAVALDQFIHRQGRG